MELNRYIDHTQLRNDARHTEIDKLIAEAKEFNFKAICSRNKLLIIIQLQRNILKLIPFF